MDLCIWNRFVWWILSKDAFVASFFADFGHTGRESATCHNRMASMVLSISLNFSRINFAL